LPLVPIPLFVGIRNTDLNNIAVLVNLRKMIEINETANVKTRIIVRKGIEDILLKVEDILLIYTENKVVYVIDNMENKYLSGNSLTELETLLDKRRFFRANRQFIINLKYIKGYKPVKKVKLSVALTIPTKYDIIISQETAIDFKKWILEA
jgi:DNA-binding LytR/AlgR family response regulator